MMKKFLNQEKGVSLITLAIAVMVILVITNMILYNVKDNLGIQKLESMQADIENLRDKVSSYYNQYGSIPAKTEYTNIGNLQTAGIISTAVDTGKFYVIDLQTLENVTLTYGQDYEKIQTGSVTTQEEINELQDLYIINEASHNVFYVRGITVDGETFYTNYTADDVDTASVDLRYVDNVKIPDGYTYVSGSKDTVITIKSNTNENDTYTWIPVEENIDTIPEGITVDNENEFLESVNKYDGYYKSQADNTTVVYIPLDENWSPTYDKTANYTDKNQDTAVIPAGFKVSREPGENMIDTGLVVQGPDGSEFVWVPVSDINSMAQCSTAGGDCSLKTDTDGHLYCETHGNSTEIVGKLYATEVGENFGTENTSYNQNSGLREPARVTGNSDGTGTSYDGQYYSNAGYSSSSNMLENLKNEYKSMAESVAKNGGFYIGRYETSLSTATTESPGTSGTAQSKSGVIPTASNNSATYMWYGLYKAQKDYTVTEDSVQSSMIWGSQYDAMINWALSGNDSSKVTAEEIGNNNGESAVTTGNPTYSNDSINNVRDLCGNLYEWTLEANDTSNRVVRGGVYSSNGPASSRFSYRPSFSFDYSGSRLTLYIK